MDDDIRRVLLVVGGIILGIVLFALSCIYGDVWKAKIVQAAKTERAQIYADGAVEIVEQICPWWETKEAKE